MNLKLKNLLFSVALLLLSSCNQAIDSEIKELGNDPKNKNVTSHQIVPDIHGLKNIKYLDRLIDNQDFALVLDLIAGETNNNLKKDWLYKKANEGHAIIMFELSKYLASNGGSLDEIQKWFFAGISRAEQDAFCYQDKSYGEIPETLSNVYSVYFKDLIENASRKQLIEAQGKAFKSSNEVIVNLKKYPSPIWIFYQNIDESKNLSNFDNLCLKSEKDCLEIRRKYAVDWAKKISDSEKQMAEMKSQVQKSKDYADGKIAMVHLDNVARQQ